MVKMSKSDLEKYMESELWYYWMANPKQSIAGYSMLCESVRDIIQMVADRDDYHLTSDDYLNIDMHGDSRIIACVERLVEFMPLTPLSGKESEWQKIYTIGSVITWQNKRYCHVMRDTTMTGKLIKVYEHVPGSKEIRKVNFPYWPGMGSPVLGRKF